MADADQRRAAISARSRAPTPLTNTVKTGASFSPSSTTVNCARDTCGTEGGVKLQGASVE
ncbi:MAG: hypothetical protein GDA49_12575 [Rhodospirillales bacterium]|nr:hypothetical protein [Rhodospirillales bacterium]